MSAEAQGVMIPVSDSDVGQLALIQALRMSTEQNTRVANSVEKMGDQLTQVARDVAILKSHDYKHELELVRQAFAASSSAGDAKLEAATAQWRADSAARDRRIEELLSKSLEERGRMWTAIETRKGEIQNLKDRVLPIFGLLATASAAIVAFMMDKVLK